QTTGWLSSCTKLGLRQDALGSYVRGLKGTNTLAPPSVLWPVSFTKAANCLREIACRATANGLEIVTLCCGSSYQRLFLSNHGDPTANSPAGTTTISGPASWSLNHSVMPAPGLNQPSGAPWTNLASTFMRPSAR